MDKIDKDLQLKFTQTALNSWINGWIDATGEYFFEICTNKKSNKKIIEYMNVMTDNNLLRKKVFDNIFLRYNFIYDIDNDAIIPC